MYMHEETLFCYLQSGECPKLLLCRQPKKSDSKILSSVQVQIMNKCIFQQYKTIPKIWNNIRYQFYVLNHNIQKTWKNLKQESFPVRSFFRLDFFFFLTEWVTLPSFFQVNSHLKLLFLFFVAVLLFFVHLANINSVTS